MYSLIFSFYYKVHYIYAVWMGYILLGSNLQNNLNLLRTRYIFCRHNLYYAFVF